VAEIVDRAGKINELSDVATSVAAAVAGKSLRRALPPVSAAPDVPQNGELGLDGSANPANCRDIPRIPMLTGPATGPVSPAVDVSEGGQSAAETRTPGPDFYRFALSAAASHELPAHARLAMAFKSAAAFGLAVSNLTLTVEPLDPHDVHNPRRVRLWLKRIGRQFGVRARWPHETPGNTPNAPACVSVRPTRPSGHSVASAIVELTTTAAPARRRRASSKPGSVSPAPVPVTPVEVPLTPATRAGRKDHDRRIGPSRY
jgi:hypothetical protein